MKLLNLVALFMATSVMSMPAPDHDCHHEVANDTSVAAPVDNFEEINLGPVHVMDAGPCKNNNDCQGGWCYNGICLADGHCRSSVDCPGRFYCRRGDCINRPCTGC
ncbi:hypothetical protein HFD88_000277 [Aspergillus terreus]|nr:hypothetical protein HFD88_000277 [Aspergillus terreus]